MPSTPRISPVLYGRGLLFIAGMGGLLYGIDVGIISSALLFLGKTVDLTISQTSAIVAAVLGGSMISSLAAGVLADWIGRKKMMLISGALFIASVGIIVLSQGFVPLLLGRILQGFSGGFIAVVVPLYLAECLSATSRGRGSAIFQFMLTFGIIAAALTGFFYTHQAEIAIAAAAGNRTLIRAAEDHAWRGMFLSIVYPGLVFFAGSFLLAETPRWLFKKGRPDAAYASLRRAVSPAEADREMHEMQSLASETTGPTGTRAGSLLQRKYVVPFALACIVLACNQATGINSILAYLAVILRQAGMSASQASQGDLLVKILNCVATVVAIVLVDRKGRKFLLSLGTGGIIVALLAATFLFHTFESKRIDLRERLQPSVHGGELTLPPNTLTTFAPQPGTTYALTLLYSHGSGDKIATLLPGETTPLHLEPEPGVNAPLTLRHAYLSPVPTERTGWLVAASLALFIASFAIGPGVVVWLALSELMPTRIRSAGMGIALLLNQGVSTLIAGIFLPVVSVYGYFAMFLVWAGCTVIYFITAVFFLPETKGRTLEEIERSFEHA